MADQSVIHQKLEDVLKEHAHIAHLMLDEIGRGSFELHHIQAADAVETIADMLFDHLSGDSELGLSYRQAQSLCSALQAISRWQASETYEMSERAKKALGDKV